MNPSKSTIPILHGLWPSGEGIKKRNLGVMSVPHGTFISIWCLTLMFSCLFKSLNQLHYVNQTCLQLSDWTCGGQWNRMLQFLASLVQTLHAHNLHLAVFFNGALEPPRMHEWVRNQLAARSNIYQVLRHLHTKGTPPPKVWWVPPSGLRTALRLALRHLKIAVVSIRLLYMTRSTTVCQKISHGNVFHLAVMQC